MIGSIILLIVLIFLNAIFASAEIAVISMNDAKLKKLTEEGNKKAIKLTKLTEQPARFLATIQVVITPGRIPEQCFCRRLFCRSSCRSVCKSGRAHSKKCFKFGFGYYHYRDPFLFQPGIRRACPEAYCHEKDRIPFPWHWLVLYTRFPRSSLPWYFFLQYLPTVC